MMFNSSEMFSLYWNKIQNTRLVSHVCDGVNKCFKSGIYHLLKFIKTHMKKYKQAVYSLISCKYVHII